MVNPHTKFEVSSFCRSRDILGSVKFFKMGHVTLIMPLSGMIFFIGKLGLAMANLYTKFEVYICTRYEDMKSGTKCRNWGGLGKYSRSSAMSQFDRMHMTSYSTLIETMHLPCTFSR